LLRRFALAHLRKRLPVGLDRFRDMGKSVMQRV
jgi:hypothetical protein